MDELVPDNDGVIDALHETRSVAAVIGGLVRLIAAKGVATEDEIIDAIELSLCHLTSVPEEKRDGILEIIRMHV